MSLLNKSKHFLKENLIFCTLMKCLKYTPGIRISAAQNMPIKTLTDMQYAYILAPTHFCLGKNSTKTMRKNTLIA